MKKSIQILFILIITIGSTAFTNSSTKNDWKLYKEIQGIQIYSKMSSCMLEHTTNSNQYLIFKYINTTKKNLRLTGRIDPYFNNLCRSCNLDSPNEYEFSISLKPGESQEGNCSDELKAFKLFYSSSDNRVAPLSKFEYSNLTVNEF